MDKDKFYKKYYKAVEDYFASFSKKPHYLLIHPQVDLTTYFDDKEDLKHYCNDRFKGMTIVRTTDIGSDKIVVY